MNDRDQAGERRAVRRVLRGLTAGGFRVLGVWDGGAMEARDGLERSAMEAIFSVDESSVRVVRADWHPPQVRRVHGILIVLGNADDGSEVVADWNYSADDADGFSALMDRLTAE